VDPGGVAAQAGIQSGDVLLKVGEKELLPPEAMPFVLGWWSQPGMARLPWQVSGRAMAVAVTRRYNRASSSPDSDPQRLIEVAG
jgi:hypothetical protein